MPAVKQSCPVCGGDSFTTSHGMRVCDQCGRQEEHYIELLSQETIGEVDRSRLLSTRHKHHDDEDGGDGGAAALQDEKLDNWTSYDAYNIILFEWTKALLKLGASPKVEAITFKLWVAYLQRIGIAFSQDGKSSSRSSLRNRRDMKLIFEKAESVSGKSLHSYSSRKRKKKAISTELDKLKDKIEAKKIRNAVKRKHDSSFLDNTLVSELSKSLHEFEASMLSDSTSTYFSSHTGDSRTNLSGKSDLTSGKSDLTSGIDGNSYRGTLESESEMERADTPVLARKRIPSDVVVKNWIRRAAHIYDSDPEEQCHKNGDEEQVQKEKNLDEESDNKEEDDDNNDDRHSTYTPKHTPNSKQQSTAKKKPLKTCKLGTLTYNQRYKRASRASSIVTNYRGSRLPFIMSFSKLLGVLYLAVLLAKDDILLSDILRWCREGHIPYYSAPYLLRPDMEISYYDLFMLRNTKKLPDAKEVQGITGRLAAFLSIQYVPLPPTASIVRKFVKLLNLPEHVATVAESLVELADVQKVLAIPPVESIAMASIILALKVYCGLDSHTEVMLSHAAAAINANMPSHSSIAPFSWLNWQKHISRVIWLCCQVDPPTALHWQKLHHICSFSPTIFTKYFWKEDMWRVPNTSLKKKTELQNLTKELLQHQGLSLEEVITQPPLFQPSRHPLHTIIQQLTDIHSTTQIKEMHRYVKDAQELTEESFAKHTLNWYCEPGDITTQLHKGGSKMQLLLNKDNGKAVISCRIQNCEIDKEGKTEKSGNVTQEFFIPHPLKNVWKIKLKSASTWDKLSPSLPSSLKWLMGVGSSVCEAPRMQLLLLTYQLQNKIR